jgi:antirestriction protein ArdC
MKVYEIITETIIQKLQQGVIPWRKPWSGGGLPKNFVSQKTYRGINLILLNNSEFSSPFWLTFNQADEIGGRIRKGQKSTIVVFWKWLNITDVNEEDKSIDKQIPFLRYYRVFNIEQTEGIDYATAHNALDFKPIDRCERVVNEMPERPPIIHKGTRAFYSPAKDCIRMPPAGHFLSCEEYYSTLFHEMAHSTGHERRLNRKSLSDYAPFGSKTYGIEELVAEFSASFLCGHTGIDQATVDNSAGYIDGWLRKIREDKKMLIYAAAKAQKAVDYILKN